MGEPRGCRVHVFSDFAMDFIDVAMVFIQLCMCSLIFAWFYKVYLGIHDVHKSNCKYLDVNPNIYIYIYIILTDNIYIYMHATLFVYTTMNIKLSANNYFKLYVYIIN